MFPGISKAYVFVFGDADGRQRGGSPSAVAEHDEGRAVVTGAGAWRWRSPAWGEVAASHGAPRRAGQLLGAGQALLPATDPLLHVIVPYDLSTQLAAARARDDPAAFDRGLSEGQAWNIDRAVAAGPAPGRRPAIRTLSTSGS